MFSKKIHNIFSIFLICGFAVTGVSDEPEFGLRELEPLRQSLGLTPYLGNAGIRDVHIVVIDEGFGGATDNLDKYFPVNTELVEYYPYQFTLENHPDLNEFEAQFQRVKNELIEQKTALLLELEKENQNATTVEPTNSLELPEDDQTTKENSTPASASVTVTNEEVIQTMQKTGAIKGFSSSEHGTELGMVIQGLAPGVKMTLLNGRGPTNLTLAVRFAYKVLKADIIVYSSTWELGNGDGTGQIGQIAKEATDRGILWFNSAGNDGGKVHHDKIRLNERNTVEFTNSTRPDSLKFVNYVQGGSVNIKVIWNSDNYNGTDKDLDVVVLDQYGKEINPALGKKSQVKLNRSLTPEEQDNGYTKLARENFDLTGLKNGGEYRIQLKSKSEANFNPQYDRVWIILEGTGVEFVDASEGYETMAPNNQKGVISVGSPERFASIGSTEGQDGKPDVLLESSVFYFNNKVEATPGTSYSNAAMGAIAAHMLAQEPRLKYEHLMRFRGSRIGLDYEDAKTSHHDLFKAFGGEGNILRVERNETSVSQNSNQTKDDRNSFYTLSVDKFPTNILNSLPAHTKTRDGQLKSNYRYFAYIQQSRQQGGQDSIHISARSTDVIKEGVYTYRKLLPWETTLQNAHYRESRLYSGKFYLENHIRNKFFPNAFLEIKVTPNQNAQNERVIPENIKNNFFRMPPPEVLKYIVRNY